MSKTMLDAIRLQHYINQLAQEVEALKKKGDPQWIAARVKFLNAQARMYEMRRGER